MCVCVFVFGGGGGGGIPFLKEQTAGLENNAPSSCGLNGFPKKKTINTNPFKVTITGFFCGATFGVKKHKKFISDDKI